MRGVTGVAAALSALALGFGCGGSGDGGDRAASAPTATAARTATATPAATAEPAAAADEAPAAPAQTARRARLQPIGDFSSPVYVTSPPGDRSRQFVVEQGGRIMVVRGGRKLSTPFLDLRGQVRAGGEQGLLSMAFAPDYRDSGRFYVYFTDRAGDQRVVEYRRAGADRAEAGSARLVLGMEDSESNHNGGLLLFGPDDLLYIGTGDGGGGGDRHGSRGNAQDLGSLLGKILRIDPRPAGGRPYRVPDGNPFTGRPGARGEIYAYGLRNPWRFSFDRTTGDLVIGDVGQNAWEEIDFVARGRGRGANFGWRPFEGRARYTAGESASGHVAPVIVQSHAAGNCSITGGVVVRDRRLALRGRYLFGDLCKGRVISARLSPGRAREVRRTSLRVDSPSSFGEDAQGRVYVTSLNGPVYRIVPR
jgi:glucose/arabinose dehydrogenase